jgi:hypothetical protein
LFGSNQFLRNWFIEIKLVSNVSVYNLVYKI